MVVGAILLVFVTVVWLYYLWSRRKFYMCALKVKGPWGYPFLGIVHKLYKAEDIFFVLANITKEYKQKTFFSWYGPYAGIYTIDPNVAEIVLQSPDCLRKSPMYKALKEGYGNGLLSISPPKWIAHRKLLNPCLSYKVLVGLMPVFNNFARQFCSQLDQHVGRGEADIKELVFKIGLKSSIATAMGANLEGSSDSKVLESFEVVSESIIYRMLRPWLQNSTVYSWTSSYKSFSRARSCILKFVQNLIEGKLKTLRDPSIDTNSDVEWMGNVSNVFINLALKIHQQNELTIDEVINETITMVFGSVETTANAMYYTLMFLAMHPQFQERAFNEISSLFEDKEFDLTSADLKNFLYLESCINEALRLAPSGPLIGRVCIKDLRISDDVTLPAGTNIFIDIFNIHRNEEIWGPTAGDYNPDHFLPSNLEGKHKYAFLPFSKGKRNCIGRQYAEMLLKVMLAQALRKYKFSTTFRYEDLKFVNKVFLSNAITPRLEVIRRF